MLAWCSYAGWCVEGRVSQAGGGLGWRPPASAHLPCLARHLRTFSPALPANLLPTEWQGMDLSRDGGMPCLLNEEQQARIDAALQRSMRFL